MNVPRWTSSLLATGTAAACVALLAWAQFSFDGLHDSDSYFHTRAAQQLAEHGVRTEFPAASLSTWREGYSDKDFLFHALLVPLCGSGDDLIRAGKWATVLTNALLLSAFLLAMKMLGIRFGALWILLFFSAHLSIPLHLTSVRPHALGVALILLEVALLLRGKSWWLLAVCAVHVWTHTSFVLAPAVAALVFGVAVVRREPRPYALLAAALGGVLFGSVLHPYAPHNWALARDQILEVAGAMWGSRPELPRDLFGQELAPMSTALFLSAFPAWLPAALALLAGLDRTAPAGRSQQVQSLAAASFLMLILAWLSARFFVFLAPVALLFAGRFWTERAAGRSLGELFRGLNAGPLLVALLLGASVVIGQKNAHVGHLRALLQARPTPSAYAPAVQYLRDNVAPDELVYHNFWWEFAALYHFRPEGRYVVGLDPIFFYRHDPELFALALQAYRGQLPDIAQRLRQDFDARYVFVSKHPQYAPFRSLIERDRGCTRVYSDGYADVFQVR